MPQYFNWDWFNKSHYQNNMIIVGLNFNWDCSIFAPQGNSKGYG